MSNKYWTDKQNDIDAILAEDFNNAFGMIANDIKKNDVDQTYDPYSEAAQSGKAVAEAMKLHTERLFVEDGYCVLPNFEGSTAVFKLTLDATGCEFINMADPDVVSEFKQILIHVDAAEAPYVQWGTSTFFNGEIPTVTEGKYDFIFEWDGSQWCAGAIEKGVVE